MRKILNFYFYVYSQIEILQEKIKNYLNLKLKNKTMKQKNYFDLT